MLERRSLSSVRHVIEQKLKEGDASVRLVPKANGKSQIWRYFGTVHFDAHPLPYVACFHCNAVYSYQGRSTGTSSMRSHACTSRPKGDVNENTKELPPSHVTWSGAELASCGGDAEGNTVEDRGPQEEVASCPEDASSSPPCQSVEPEVETGTEADAPVQQKPESYQLRHNNHLSLVLEALAHDEAFMDVTLTAQGRSIKAHKSVLSAVSPYFRGVLRENPCQHPIIIMPRDVCFDELNSIVTYIYKGEMTVAAEDLPSLLKTADLLQVSGLSPSESGTSVDQSVDSLMAPHSQGGLSADRTPPDSTEGASSLCCEDGTFSKAAKQEPINPADFMDVDLTCVKEEVASEDNDEDDKPTSHVSKKRRVSSERNAATSQGTSSPPLWPSAAPQGDAPPKGEVQSADDVGGSPGDLEDPPPFVCPHCRGVYRPSDHMATHLFEQHANRQSYPCRTCGRVFVRQRCFSEHVLKCS